MTTGLPPARALDPFRSFEAAWKLLKQAPVTVLIGGLLLGFLGGGGGGGSNFAFRFNDIQHSRDAGQAMRDAFEAIKPWLLLIVPMVLCVWIAFFALSSWIEVGFARAVEYSLRTGKDEIAKVFSGGDRFGAMLLARLLAGLIQFATVLPMLGVVVVAVLASENREIWAPVVIGVVGFVLLWAVLVAYVGLGLYFVDPIIAYEDCTPTESLSRSWALASGKRWRLFWFLIVQGFMNLAGFCMCCIGIFVAIPLTQAMRFECYLALTRGGDFREWWIGSGKFAFDDHKSEDFSSPPPPPQAPPPLPPQG